MPRPDTAKSALPKSGKKDRLPTPTAWWKKEIPGFTVYPAALATIAFVAACQGLFGGHTPNQPAAPQASTQATPQ